MLPLFVAGKVDPCSNQPCLNGATCMRNPVHPDVYVCFCAYGFKGRHCETGSAYALDGIVSYMFDAHCMTVALIVHETCYGITLIARITQSVRLSPLDNWLNQPRSCLLLLIQYKSCYNYN